MEEFSKVWAFLDAKFFKEEGNKNLEDLELQNYASWFGENRIQSLQVGQSGMRLPLEPTALQSPHLQRLAFHLDPALSDQSLMKGLLGLGSFPNLRTLEVLCWNAEIEAMGNTVGGGSVNFHKNNQGIHEAVGMIFDALASTPHLQELNLEGKLYCHYLTGFTV
jgi:hypothetical protein